MAPSAKSSKAYAPALGVDWLLPLYDPILRAAIPEEAIKRRLVELARIEAGHRVLDVGCGTATLTVLIKAMHPDADVVGLDPDGKALERARAKATAEHLQIAFDEGTATALPYETGSIDRVLSAFVFHHLTLVQKRDTLREVVRVLRPGGSFHLLDFGRPRSRVGIMLGYLLHPARNARDNIRGHLPELMRGAGLRDVEEQARRVTVVGSMSYLTGRKA